MIFFISLSYFLFVSLFSGGYQHLLFFVFTSVFEFRTFRSWWHWSPTYISFFSDSVPLHKGTTTFHAAPTCSRAKPSTFSFKLVTYFRFSGIKAFKDLFVYFHFSWCSVRSASSQHIFFRIFTYYLFDVYLLFLRIF